MSAPDAGNCESTLRDARAALATGRYHDAIAHLRPLAGGTDPGAREAGLLLARALRAAGRTADAVAVLQEVFSGATSAGDAEGTARALAQLGLVSEALGNAEDAETLLRQALTLSPGLAEAVTALARLRSAAGQFEEARALLRDAHARDPAAADLLCALGPVEAEAGALAEAEEALRRALALRPDFGEAHSNLGNVLRDRGRIEEARRHYDLALAHLPQGVPGHARARVNRAMARLLAGDFVSGWNDYEWRLKLPEARDVSVLPPAWDGSPLGTRTLLLYPEQGIGDVIMFATLVPELAAAGARIVLRTPGRLQTLLARALPACTVVPDPGAGTGCDVADASLALGSLPRFLRRDARAFAGRGPTAACPFLVPDPAALARWRAQLQEATGGARVLGFAWRGGATRWDRMLRQTQPGDWRALLARPDIHWVALQYGMTEDERTAFAALAPGRVHAFPDTGADLDDFAALVAALDGVVSADNSTVHMAGALGRPVATLVPEVPTWRWGLAGTESLWYPTMRLARRDATTPWETVISGLTGWVSDGPGKDWQGGTRPL